MPIIRFVESWNGKLNKKVFTTIRRCDEKKRYYYQKQLGKSISGKAKGTGILPS